MHLPHLIFSVILASLLWQPFVTATTTTCTTCLSSELLEILADQVVQTPTVTLVIAPPSVVVTTTAGTGITNSGTSDTSRGSGSSPPFQPNSTHAPNITQTPAARSTPTTTTSGAGETLKMHSTLRSVLAIYTIAFTLFLLPMPTTSLLELLILLLTATTGWTLLYLDSLLTFLSDPKSHLHHLADTFYWGLDFYIRERWATYQLIRRRNPPRHHHRHRHTSISLPPSNAPHAKIRLGAWWKSDVVTTLKTHSNLRDYVLTPQNFSLEKYTPTAPGPYYTPLRMKPRHEDDIFSSDEELDTSPLATKFPIPMVARRTTTGAVESGDSKKTVVDAGVSEREKVSGFISWDALKRDFGGEEEKPAADGVVRTETEGSGRSWEREALGAAI